jgi:hypothetical protein
MSPPFGIGDRHSNGLLMNIQSKELAKILQELPPQWRLPRLWLNKPQVQSALLEVGRSVHDVYAHQIACLAKMRLILAVHMRQMTRREIAQQAEREPLTARPVFANVLNRDSERGPP